MESPPLLPTKKIITMPKRKLPDTSHEAKARVTPERLQGHYGKIIKALQVLGTGTYEQIATTAFMEPHSVARRLKEMEGMGIVFKPGTKLPTKTGRNAYQYTLCIKGQIVEKKTEKLMEGKSVSDFSKQIIQKTLF